MNVWGLDLSTSKIGCATGTGELVSFSARAGAKDPYRRLSELRREVVRNLRTYPPAPELVVVEDYALASPGRMSLVRLGEIGGVIRTELFELGYRIALVPPTSLKRFATGNGAAKKPQMIDAAIAAGARDTVNDDEADAFHLRRMGLAAHGLLPDRLLQHELDAIANAGTTW